MKRFLTAAAAVSLLAAGAAYAQVADPNQGGPAGSMNAGGAADPSNSAANPNGVTPQAGGSTDQTPSQGGMSAGQSGGSMSQGGMGQGSADQGAASQGSMSSGAQTADTPSAAPGNYPRCTSRGQDRCTQTGAQMASSEKATSGHSSPHRHAARKASKSKASTSAASTSATAQ